MKKMILGVVVAVALMPCAALAQDVVPAPAAEVTAVQVDALGTVDLARFFSNVRTGYLFGHDQLASAYIPLISVKGRTDVEYLNLDAGVGFNPDTRKGKPIMILGGRVDSFLRKIGTMSPRIKTATFPALEVGPTVLVDFSSPAPFKNLKFMFSVAYKIGG